MAGTVATEAAAQHVPDGMASCDYCQLPVPAVVGHSPVPAYCCYGCQFAAQVAQASGPQARLNWLVARLGLSIFLSMAVMVFTLYLYSQVWYGDERVSPAQSTLTAVMRYCSMIFATPVVLLLGLPIADNALSNLRRGILSAESLVTLGVTAAFIYSYYNTVISDGATYYETTCMILVLFTCGRWLEASHRLGATDTLRGLAGLLPDRAVVRRGDDHVEVAPAEVRVNDWVVVQPGERCCVDGVIVEGHAYVDTALVTGESHTTVKDVGDSIEAGTAPHDGPLVVQAERVGHSTTIGRFEKLLDAARSSRGHFERLADRLATVFVPLIAVLAGVGAVLGYGRGGLGEGILTALAVVLIACPCAVGIATPLAVWAALGQAAKRGVLIRSATVLERLAEVRHVCFDKTGTLTTTTPRVVDIHCASGTTVQQVMGCARGLADCSAHVLSRAIVTWCRDHDVPTCPARDIKTVGGRGVSGTSDGATVMLGNRPFMLERNITIRADVDESADHYHAADHTVVYIAHDGQAIGLVAFNECSRTSAQRAVQELAGLDCQVAVLTGDDPRRGQRLGADLSVTVHAGLTPADKIDHIRRLQQDGAVVMVGEGLNDAPALAAGDVGIALGCGADLSRDSADICLLKDDVAAVPWLIALARRTMSTIRVNLFWAFAYNIVGIGVALAGYLNPIVAAGAMVLSSIFVVSHSLRIAAQEGRRSS